MKIRGDKRAIEMGFNWMFAIIVGVVIIFIAIYGTSKFINTSQYKVSTETAAQLDTILDPLRPGLADGKAKTIGFKKDTRTYFECSDAGDFGKNKIAFSEKTFGDFSDKGGFIDSQKYIFSEKMIEGKELNIFSKPFFFPFKTDDIIVISGENYCFINAPNEIENEILGLGMKNIKIAESVNDVNCSGVNVCFDSQCDISVYGMCEDNCESNYDYGKVFKRGETIYYSNSLLYAAIMSDIDIYNCNLKRLMKRVYLLGGIYLDKTEIMELNGCSSKIKIELDVFRNQAKELETSEELFLLSLKSKNIDKANQATSSACKLYLGNNEK